MMKYILDNPFVISLNVHDGSIVASYPFDDLKVCAIDIGSFSLYSNHSISDTFNPWEGFIHDHDLVLTTPLDNFH